MLGDVEAHLALSWVRVVPLGHSWVLRGHVPAGDVEEGSGGREMRLREWRKWMEEGSCVAHVGPWG